MITLTTIPPRQEQFQSSQRFAPELFFDNEKRIVTIGSDENNVNLTKNSRVSLEGLVTRILNLGHPGRTLKVDLTNVGGIDNQGLKALGDLVGNRRGVLIELINASNLVSKSLNRLPSLARRAS